MDVHQRIAPQCASLVKEKAHGILLLAQHASDSYDPSPCSIFNVSVCKAMVSQFIHLFLFFFLQRRLRIPLKQ